MSDTDPQAPRKGMARDVATIADLVSALAPPPESDADGSEPDEDSGGNSGGDSGEGAAHKGGQQDAQDATGDSAAKKKGDADGIELSDTLPMAAEDDLSKVRGSASPRLVSIVESLLFAAERPMGVRDLRRILKDPTVRQVQLALKALRKQTESRGIVLGQVAGGFRFRTNPDNARYVQRMLAGRPARLSRMQLETLAIVAYRQPITKAEIDHVRGVDCGAVLKLLLERDLARIVGRKEEPGRPHMYGTTVEFLEFFNLMSLRDMPDLHEFRELTEDSRAQLRDHYGEAADEVEAEVLGQERLFDAANDAGDTPSDNAPSGEAEAAGAETGAPETAGAGATEAEPAEAKAAEAETTEAETEAESAEAESAETESAETESAEAESAETETTEAEPAENEPAENESAEPESADSPEAEETEPTDTEPTDTEPTDTEPTEVEPTEVEPTDAESVEAEREPESAEADSETVDSETAQTDDEPEQPRASELAQPIDPPATDTALDADPEEEN